MPQSPPDGAGRRGVNAAFLGVDGIGKRQIVSAVQARCEAEGTAVHRVSWQRHLAAGNTAGHPGADLERMWTGLYRIFFAEALVAGRPVAVPDSFRELVSDSVIGRLRDLPVAGVSPDAPVPTAWVEMAGHTLLHHAVIQPLVQAGTVVLQDSLGVKNVLKSLLIAEICQPGSAGAFTAARASVREYFGRGLAPDVGFLLVGDPGRVLEVKGVGGIGLFDSLRAFGGDPAGTFLDLQSRCAAEYAALAGQFGWHQLDIRDSGEVHREETVDQIMDMLHAAMT